MNGPEVYATIFTVAPGKVDAAVIWTGSDDGVVQVTRDGGANWTNITPPDMPELGRVSLIDASAFDAGRAYMAVKRPLLDDKAPYVWKTEDFGNSWTKIVNGLRDDAFVHTVREDPARPGLLYAGTNHGVYVSYDDGDHWQELNPGFPDIPVSSLVVEDDALAIASHGRGFWILDNIAPLRQATPGMTEEEVILFEPASAMRSSNGAVLTWWQKEMPREAAGDPRRVRYRAPDLRTGRLHGGEGPLGRRGFADGDGVEQGPVGPPNRSRPHLPGDDSLGGQDHVGHGSPGRIRCAVDGG
jgi:hypothetical protein